MVRGYPYIPPSLGAITDINQFNFKHPPLPVIPSSISKCSSFFEDLKLVIILSNSLAFCGPPCHRGSLLGNRMCKKGMLPTYVVL